MPLMTACCISLKRETWHVADWLSGSGVTPKRRASSFGSSTVSLGVGCDGDYIGDVEATQSVRQRLHRDVEAK